MGSTPRRGFTLVELLIVIVIIMLLAALLLPAIIKAMCNGRAAAAKHMISQVEMAASQYESMQGVYPPGKGDGSKELVYYLEKKGPRNQPYFEFQADQKHEGNIVNPVWGHDGEPPSNIIKYRNNVATKGLAPKGGGGMPPIYNKTKFDMWAAGCDFKPGNEPSLWSVNNWE
ncbi:MAG TPA: prepilin-type N-terminal cleavage/methylation domain-containing protein [Planctomycetota bacterium]|nr:prepilin-type N-terminal cleavage/methylation domain-containing protein [Planctomycetota bacterium]